MKNPVKQEKKEEVQEIESTGKFSFENNTFYEGGYKILVSGEKVRHGKGRLFSPGFFGQLGEEFYDGDWVNDKFEGFGIYQYSNGDYYKGEFKNGSFNGNGEYVCTEGTKYIGEFVNNKFHGRGKYFDSDGLEWKGEFREGFYSSKQQAQLKEEARLYQKNLIYENYPKEFFKKWEETISKVDKKTAKDLLSPFFGDKDLANYIKDPFTKFDEKPYDKWNELFKFCFNSANIFKVTVGGAPGQELKLIDKNRILCSQFNEDLIMGQVIETTTTLGDRNVYLGLGFNQIQDKWQLIFVKDETIKHKK